MCQLGIKNGLATYHVPSRAVHAAAIEEVSHPVLGEADLRDVPVNSERRGLHRHQAPMVDTRTARQRRNHSETTTPGTGRNRLHQKKRMMRCTRYSTMAAIV